MAGPYLYIGMYDSPVGFNPRTGGVVVWDTSTDTQVAYLTAAKSICFGGLHLAAPTVAARLLTVGNGSTISQTANAYGVVSPSGSPSASYPTLNGLGTVFSNQFSAAAISPDGLTIYALDASGYVHAFLSTGGNATRSSVAPVSGATNALGGIVSPDGATLFVGNPITAYNTSDLSVKYTTSYAPGVTGSVCGFSTNGSIAYAFTGGNAGGSIIGFHTADGSLVGQSTGAYGSYHGLRFAVSPDGAYAYTSSSGLGSGQVNQINLSTFSPAALNPSIVQCEGVAITPDGLYLYVGQSANAGSGSNVPFYKIRISDGTVTTLQINNGGDGSLPYTLIADGPIQSPPSAPTGLAWAGCEGSQVTLSWSAVPGATSYRVYANGVLFASGITSTSYVLSPVTIGTPISLTVSAVSVYGEGAQSSPLVVTPCSVTTPCCNWQQVNQASGCVYTATDQVSGCVYTPANQPCT